MSGCYANFLFHPCYLCLTETQITQIALIRLLAKTITRAASGSDLELVSGLVLHSEKEKAQAPECPRVTALGLAPDWEMDSEPVLESEPAPDWGLALELVMESDSVQALADLVALGFGIAAGFETSVPVAAGVRCRERRPRATLRAGANEHCIVAPGTDVSVRRSPDLRARIETIVGAVVVSAGVVVAPVGISPTWNATAV